jgi:starvation-inducible DNA-binding protein
MIAPKLAVAATAPLVKSASELVAGHLQKQVANAFILFANYKHYHWQTYGPLFGDMHLFFGDLANSVLLTIDELAERLRIMGENPVSDYRVLLDMSRIRPARSRQTMKEMLTEARDNLLPVISDMRDAAGLAGEGNDPGTVDLFSKTVRLHEKHEWFLRQILTEKDGLIA